MTEVNCRTCGTIHISQAAECRAAGHSVSTPLDLRRPADVDPDE